MPGMQLGTSSLLPRIATTELLSLGGGGWTRTNDLRIMRPTPPVGGEEDKPVSPADSSKILQNSQPPRNRKEGE